MRVIMFYKISEFPTVFPPQLYLANMDVLSDMLPVVSTISNLARLIFKTAFQVLSLSVSTGLIPIFLIKAIKEAIQVRDIKAFSINYQSYCRLSLKIHYIWTSHIFTLHLFSKDLKSTIVHAIPLIGNLIAAIQAKSFGSGTKQEVYSKISSLQNQAHLQMSRFIPLQISPYFVPKGLEDDKHIYLANFKENPFAWDQIPDALFQDQEFILELFNLFTSYYLPTFKQVSQEERKHVLSQIIERAKTRGLFAEIILPIENLYLCPNLIELTRKYPFILWMLPNIEYFEKKKKLSRFWLIILKSSHVSHHTFLKDILRFFTKH